MLENTKFNFFVDKAGAALPGELGTPQERPWKLTPSAALISLL